MNKDYPDLLWLYAGVAPYGPCTDRSCECWTSYERRFTGEFGEPRFSDD